MSDISLKEFGGHVAALQNIVDDAYDSPEDVAEISYPNVRKRLQALWALVAPRAEDNPPDFEGEPRVGGAMDSNLRVTGHRAVAEAFGGGAVADAAIEKMCRDNHIKSRG